MKISLETVVAALVDQNEGELFLGREFMEKDYDGMVLAMTYDAVRNGMQIELVEESRVTYDDNE